MFLQDLMCLLVSLLAVWGAVGLAYTLALGFARPKTGETAVLTLFLRGDPSAAVGSVSRALTRLSVTGALSYTRVAAVCAPADEALLAALRQAYRFENRVVVCTKTEYAALFLR